MKKSAFKSHWLLPVILLDLVSALYINSFFY